MGKALMEIRFATQASGSVDDGAVLAIKPDGWLISARDMEGWIDKDIEPAIVATMPAYQQARHRREVRRVRYWTTHTDAEIAATFGIAEENVADTKQQYVSERTQLEAHGLDTNWGFEELKHGNVLRVEDMTLHEIADAVEAEYTVDVTGSRLSARIKRVEYDKELDAAELIEARDRDLRCDVNRTRTPMSKTRIVAR